MKKTLLFLGFFALLSSPSTARAAVRISEIAWMGTAASANNEWMELWNDGNDSVNLTGWTLVWGEGSNSQKKVTLAGVIPAGGYYLLERTDDTTVPGITADLIYAGALGNSGENLQLKNSTAVSVDSVSAVSGWPAGDNASKQTMQLSGGVWKTALATPKAPTVGAPLVSSLSTTEAFTASTTATTTVATGTSPAPLRASSHASPMALGELDEPPALVIAAGRDRLTAPETPVEFVARAVLGKIPLPNGVTYRWSFGDGGEAVGERVHHVYSFDGTYAVVLNAEYVNEHAVARTRVRVAPLALSLVLAKEDGVQLLSLSNQGKEEVNLGDWKVESNRREKIFPKDTILESGGSISIKNEELGGELLGVGDDINLVAPTGKTRLQRLLAVTLPPIISATTALPVIATTTIIALLDRVAQLKAKAETLITTMMSRKQTALLHEVARPIAAIKIKKEESMKQVQSPDLVAVDKSVIAQWQATSTTLTHELPGRSSRPFWIRLFGG